MTNATTSREGVFSRVTHALHYLYVWGVSLALVFTWYASGSATENDAAIQAYKLKVLTVAVSIVPVALLLLFTYFAITNGRKARYAETMEIIHGIHHELRDLYSNMRAYQHNLVIPDHRDPVDDQFRYFIKDSKVRFRAMFLERMQLVLSKLVYSYGVTSGVNCRASIKLIGQVDKSGKHSADNLYVKTLVRDINSARDCAQKDACESTEHLVSENTDFELIVKKKRNYYYSSNINSEDNYDNSSKLYWETHYPIRKAAGTIPFASNFLGLIRHEWASSYPYVSVMVFPIRCKDEAGKAGSPIGFLSVDSKAKRSFWERYDVHLGASVADAIYHVLEEYVQTLNKLQRLVGEEKV